ncbi:hypothetical protein BAUCODRAFT_56388, partial [Baudoinia panamericana UAMH 10762]
LSKLQKDYLIEKMKNLRKTKHATPFLQPVDPVALNIPSYPEIVKQPMDVGTIDAKLKSNQYGSAQELVDDFNLIISNTRTFNGDQHFITQQGMTMKAYFDKFIELLPHPDEPQIRRSGTDRPARAIKPPANREIPYAKPRRKAHQLELKFCEHVLDELRSPKYSTMNHVFLYPVDPVALNIPHYRQVVKNPMDLSSMAQKLKQGQYEKAGEFRKDFELMIDNCLLFNPPGNAVRDIGIAFKR